MYAFHVLIQKGTSADYIDTMDRILSIDISNFSSPAKMMQCDHIIVLLLLLFISSLVVTDLVANFSLRTRHSVHNCIPLVFHSCNLFCGLTLFIKNALHNL